MISMNMTFPDNFRFGVADADLQVIGEDRTRAEEDSQPTMWDHFARHSGKAFGNHTPGIGADRFTRWREDVDIMRKMGLRHYRTSISMSRFLHENGDVNSKAAEWYTNYFRSLKDAGISVYATLHHWDIPQQLNEKGGWTNRDIVDIFGKFAGKVAGTLGEYIDEYFILNEPWCSSLLSYYEGTHAPGRPADDAQALPQALLAAHNLLLAQGVAYQVLREGAPKAKLATSINVQPAYAYSDKSEDIEAARIAGASYYQWFFDPMFIGRYPESMVELYGKAMPKFGDDDMEVIKVGGKLDALGINYYRGALYAYDKNAQLKFSEVKADGPTNDLGWPIFVRPIYPEAMYDILGQVYYSYEPFGLKRIYITENGMALKSVWDGKSSVLEDDRRIEYMREHLRQLGESIKRGIPVEAYFTWTLLDNYEWAEGYRPESAFGLIHVDREPLGKGSMDRVWKKSAYWYRDLIKSRVLT